MNIDKVLIIDFGSQVTKLIARRVRELGVYSEILNINHLKNIKNLESVKGIILSGGPASVTQKKYPKFQKKYFKKNSNSWNMLRFTTHIKIFWRKSEK